MVEDDVVVGEDGGWSLLSRVVGCAADEHVPRSTSCGVAAVTAVTEKTMKNIQPIQPMVQDQHIIFNYWKMSST
jgi:hypothetical protein